MSPTTKIPGWGTGTELSAMEAMMWRSERDPLLQSSGVVMELLDSTPDWDRLLDGHVWALRRIPRLRHRIVDDPTLLGAPVWAESEVELDHHICRVGLTDTSIDDVLAIAAELHMAEFDRSRPLWQAMLIEGLPEGRSAYLFKLHHVMADGAAVVRLFNLLHSDRREPSADKPELPVDPPSALAPADVSVRNVRRTALGSVGTAATLARGVLGKSTGAIRDPRGTLAFARSLARVSTQTPGTPSPLLARRGLKRRLGIIEIPLDDLRAAGKATGGTLNDAFLGGLLGGLHLYHERHGATVGDIPLALPVSLRTVDEDEAGGNKFAGARVAGPAGAMGPRERMQLVGGRVRAARFEPALDFLGISSGLLSRLPPALLARLTRSFTTSIDVQASNFRGLDREAYIAGARVERWFAFGPVPGSAMMATLTSQLGVCCITVAYDTDAVPDGDELMAALRDGFDEVLALKPPDASTKST